MLTILTRTSNRPTAFARMYESVKPVLGHDVELIVSYDHASSLTYIPEGVKAIPVAADTSRDCFYNEYCNPLKSLVDKGWFFFLDDDDTLIQENFFKLREITEFASPGAIIIQFMRGTYLKPHPAIFSECKIREGHIGLPCLVLHSDYKNVAMVNHGEYADSHFIRDVVRKVPTTWVHNLPIISSPSRGKGVMEIE